MKNKKDYLGIVLLLSIFSLLSYALNIFGASILLQSISIATTMVTAIYKIGKSVKKSFPHIGVAMTLEPITTKSGKCIGRKFTLSIKFNSKNYRRRSRRLFSLVDNPIRYLLFRDTSPAFGNCHSSKGFSTFMV